MGTVAQINPDYEVIIQLLYTVLKHLRNSQTVWHLIIELDPHMYWANVPSK